VESAWREVVGEQEFVISSVEFEVLVLVCFGGTVGYDYLGVREAVLS
jgi:hypothetical protein